MRHMPEVPYVSMMQFLLLVLFQCLIKLAHSLQFHTSIRTKLCIS